MITSDGSALKHILKWPEVESRDFWTAEVGMNTARDRMNLSEEEEAAQKRASKRLEPLVCQRSTV
jgi:hypothetical protein